MKKLLLTCLLSSYIFASSNILQIGDKFPNNSFKDQFEKEYIITNDTKKLLFAFSKDNGHIIKEFMGDKPTDFLIKKEILFIADISAMPSIIASWFAIPDMKKSKYPILLIQDEDIAAKYKLEDKKESFMIVELENKQVKNIKYISGKENIINWIQEN